MIGISLVFLLIVGSLVAAAAAYLGSFMVLKRMSLVGDALSHVALPGMALALVFHVSPMLGAFIALTLAVIGIWYVSETTSVYPEAIVGVAFTMSLALGVLLTPEPELLEALFGNIERITIIEGIVAALVAVLVIVATIALSKKLLLGILSEEFAKSTGVQTSKMNLVYLLLVGTVVALGVKFVGTLLMGGLVIIPAASAKNISRGIHQYHALSVLFGVISALVGIVIANIAQTSAGPLVVLTSILIFVTTYLLARRTR